MLGPQWYSQEFVMLPSRGLGARLDARHAWGWMPTPPRYLNLCTALEHSHFGASSLAMDHGLNPCKGMCVLLLVERAGDHPPDWGDTGTVLACGDMARCTQR